MRRYSHAFRVLMDQELFNLLAEASTKTGIPKSRFVRYAIQPFSYTELAPGTTDWNDVYRTDPDPEHPLKRGRQLNVMLTGDEYEMLCRAAFKLGIARSAWVRERVYALLCRSYADELSPLTDASIRDNATMLLLYYLYQVGFSFWDTNYAAAITVVLLAFLAAIALFQFGYADKRVHYR